MSQAYDVEFRERAVAAYKAGEGGYHQLARVFVVGYRTLQRWVALERATGSVAPQPDAGGWRCPIDMNVLEAVVREAPDDTVAELFMHARTASPLQSASRNTCRIDAMASRVRRPRPDAMVFTLT